MFKALEAAALVILLIDSFIDSIFRKNRKNWERQQTKSNTFKNTETHFTSYENIHIYILQEQNQQTGLFVLICWFSWLFPSEDVMIWSRRSVELEAHSEIFRPFKWHLSEKFHKIISEMVEQLQHN